jgi:hypothetical protein
VGASVGVAVGRGVSVGIGAGVSEGDGVIVARVGAAACAVGTDVVGKAVSSYEAGSISFRIAGMSRDKAITMRMIWPARSHRPEGVSIA